MSIAWYVYFRCSRDFQCGAYQHTGSRHGNCTLIYKTVENAQTISSIGQSSVYGKKNIQYFNILFHSPCHSVHGWGGGWHQLSHDMRLASQHARLVTGRQTGRQTGGHTQGVYVQAGWQNPPPHTWHTTGYGKQTGVTPSYRNTYFLVISTTLDVKEHLLICRRPELEQNTIYPFTFLVV